jgi:predicted phage tail protein
MEQLELQGRKGGEEKAHTPVETRNNLLSKSYAKVLLAVGEGEFAGLVTAQDIYLDGTPLVSNNGMANFGGVKWDYRPGRVDQTHIPGMPEISNEFPLNYDLEDIPYTRLITDSSLDAIRVTLSWPALLEQKANGDIIGYNIAYAIDIATDGGGFVEQGVWDTNNGKTTVEYNRTHRITLPPGTSWTLRIRRNTLPRRDLKIQDKMIVKAYAEVIDARLRYPNTALLYVEFDAELFGGSSIPRISLRTKGRLIQVPNNYDPNSRTYSGVWNGAFKWAWTDNPAWVFYDLVVNERFGLGSRITPEMVDKWTLYQVAQYCDVMVKDGNGGFEPRYTCNIYIQSRREAWQVLRDIVGIFNGMLYWSGTQMVASADMPVAVNTVRNYSRSNVIDGKFQYSSTSEKTIYTTALVSYDNPDNHFETAVEAVNDLGLVQRYKTWAQAEISAIGCTSRGEAQRKGKYTMMTNGLNRVVTFKLGLEGYLPRPGEVIGVADQVLAGASLAGRISAATRDTITLDRVSNAAVGDILYVNKADGVLGEGRTIQSVNGSVIKVTANYSVAPTPELGWYVEKTDLKSQLYRVTKVTWNDDEGKFDVSGVQYEDSKYAAVDSGARLELRPITSIPAGGQDAPTNLVLSSFTFIEQTMAVTTMSVRWDRAAGAMNYEAQWRKDGGDWTNVGLTASTGFDVKGIYRGAYQARVRAINAIGTKSVWAESVNTQMNGKAGSPPAVSDFKALPLLFGIRLEWYFPEGAEDTIRTEIMYSENESFDNAIPLGDYSYPANTHEMHGLLAGKRLWFWCRLVDRSGLIGPWFPAKDQLGIPGQSAINDNGQYNDYFAGLIADTALDEELYARIELIDGEGPGSVNERLDEAVIGLENKIKDITDALVYDPEKSYVAGDIVRQGNKLYQALTDVPVATPPPDQGFWKDIGIMLQDANSLASKVAINTVNISNIDGKLTSTVSSIESMQAAYRNDDGVGDQDDAIIGWDSRAQINTERVVRATADEAIASELVTFSAKVAENSASITTLTQVVADNESSTATRLDELEATVNDDVAAAIASEATVRATADEALATQVDTVRADMVIEKDRVSALVQSESTARVNADGALGTRIDTVQAAAGDNTAAIQQVSTAQATTAGKVNTSWTLKMEVNSQGQYVAAGIGLGIENGPAGLQSQFLVRADRFAVVNGINGTTSAPFVVQGGQVFISQALIGTGWITNAMIGDTIQSNNFVANSTGWRMNKAGTLELNGNVPGLGRLVINNNVLQVFDVNGVLRVRLGMW